MQLDEFIVTCETNVYFKRLKVFHFHWRQKIGNTIKIEMVEM
jgi:hypothetical protein